MYVVTKCTLYHFPSGYSMSAGITSNGSLMPTPSTSSYKILLPLRWHLTYLHWFSVFLAVAFDRPMYKYSTRHTMLLHAWVFGVGWAISIIAVEAAAQARDVTLGGILMARGAIFLAERAFDGLHIRSTTFRALRGTVVLVACAAFRHGQALFLEFG